MIGILIIATGKYKQFVNPLIKSAIRYMFTKSGIAFFVFSDEHIETDSSINQRKIKPYKFPFASLYRYKIFYNNKDLFSYCSHLIYMDADMLVADHINEEILGRLIAVRHPGFYKNNGWGSLNNSVKSASWIPKAFRNKYYAGGFQGGETKHYLDACYLLDRRIDQDKRNGVLAEWHDETHWNKYCNFDRPELVTELTPAYCMPEESEKRQAWGIEHIGPKVLALAKNHKLIRQ